MPKVTLELPEQLYRELEEEAKRKGMSVEELVKERIAREAELPPNTAYLAGLLRGKRVSEQDYKDYLEAKYK